MKLILLNISPSVSVWKRGVRRLKNFIRNRFFFYGGPQTVLNSLIRGFNELGVDYRFNPKSGEIGREAVVGVLSNVKALKWAIEAKKAGKIKKIIAGPNLVILPADAGGIMLDENIDLILAPSGWVRDFWISVAPELGPKIKIWAAGIKDSGVVAKPPHAIEAIPECLVYQKNADRSLLGAVIGILKNRNIDFKIINYGRYKKSDYFKILKRVEFMIYLSKSESQGLALCEAWMRNVPTLVWNRGFMEWKSYRWEAENISAPYLVDDCGMFFKGEKDLAGKLGIFLEKLKEFRPREYAMNNFTDKICAQKYLEIIY